MIRSSSGTYLNRDRRDSNHWVLTRRFFLADDYSIATYNSSSIIRYARLIHLHVELQPSRDGLIYPPYLWIEYAEKNNSQNDIVNTKLSVSYETDPTRHNREWVLMAYLIATLCLKFVALVHTILQLILQETFFIDWERPHVVEDSQTNHPISKDVSKDRIELPVVVWRTYLVANEWAELRCVRATCLGLQLLLVLMLLEAFNFMRFSIIQPGFGIGSPSAESTILSRFAVVVLFYLLVGFLQWVVQLVVVERMIQDPFHNFIDLCSIANISVLALTHPLHGHYIHGRSVHGRADTGMAEMNEFLQKERDPFHNFIDLCSIANISVLALTHPLHGHYIHGRSVHGRADTGMVEMNEFLQKERDDLCGFRGLEPTSHLQTFTVCLPTAFRTRYDEIMNSANNAMTQTRLTGLDQTTAKMAATVRAHEQMNIFLREMIDHSTTDVDYVIRDPSEVGFSRCFLYGREWAHFSFETTLFCVTYLLLNSLTLAAAIVFCVSGIIRALTSLLCTNHLVKSSLVDHRFLI
ncbi:unnamed protein product [Strongylus vulgaris]|uniref:Meckelin n=1 Tax=Strongylus vulgaris TaxID=40348 RepID=A0A3P7IZ44_STRVU|nr:unnamed protein product [Strongylus vulgaris]